AGTYTLRWTISNGTCNVLNGSASTSDVIITRLDSPSAAVVGSPQIICTDGTTLIATPPAVGIGNWTLVSGAGTILNPSSNNAFVVSLGVGNNVFKWSISNGNCPPSETTLVVTRTAQPSIAIAGNDQTICGTSTSITGNLPVIGTGSWSVFSQPSGANATFANASQYNTNVGNLTLVGTYVIRWTIANGVCTSSTSDLIITKQQSPSVATAGLNQQICNTSFTLNATPPTNGTGTWSVASVPQGAVIAFNNINNPAATATGFTLIGNYVLKWTVANGICPPSESTIVITRETGPSPANAGQPQTVCADNATLTANDPTLGTGAWSVVTGTGTFQNPTSYITQVTNLGFGQNVFRWTITGTICSLTSSTVVITRLQLPTISNAGTAQTLCSTTATLNANTPIVGTGTWIIMSGGAVIANPNVPNATVTNLGVGANVFKWSISNGSCSPSESFVTIIRDENPSISNAGINQQVCGTVATLSANNPLVGIGTWTVVSGTGTINSINGNTTSVSNLAVGDNIFRWTIANGTCPSTTSTVTITRFVQPANADAGSDKELCGASIVTMTAVPVTAGVGTWSQIEGPNTATFSNVNNPSATANGLIGGIYRFRWTVANGVCITTTDDVLVTNVPTPNTSNLLVVSDIAFCEGQQAFIDVTITNTQAGVLYEIRNAGVPLANSVSAGGLLTLTFSGNIFTTAPALQTIYNLEVYATPATLNNVQCPAVLLTDRARVTVNLCNNPITNPITRFTDFCTILNVDLMAVNNNDPANFNATVVTNFVTSNGGIVNILANGKATYQPRTNFLGTDTFTYRICNKDTPQICNQGTVTVNVIACTNGAPIAVNDVYNTDNCTVVNGNALTNDRDPNNSPITAVPIAPFLTSKGGVFSMDATGAFIYTPKAGFVGADEIEYQVCDDGSGTPVIKCTTAKIQINIADCNNIYIPDGFSPNGDGINDLFVIVGADKFDIELRIYDRWGNLIFQDAHYKNTWDGRVNVGLYNQNAEGVPNGTYFYVVDLRDGSKPRGRYLTIQR
ncbi:MAG: gliding motility-associated C-terminal domain-containing protein, partial [Cytophagales bacterium]